MAAAMPQVVSTPRAASAAKGADFFVPLESLRGVAALIVVVYHAVWLNPVTNSRFFMNGALMVDFFFVLSGFVIFHSYGDRLSSFRDFGRSLAAPGTFVPCTSLFCWCSRRSNGQVFRAGALWHRGR